MKVNYSGKYKSASSMQLWIWIYGPLLPGAQIWLDCLHFTLLRKNLTLYKVKLRIFVNEFISTQFNHESLSFDNFIGEVHMHMNNVKHEQWNTIVLNDPGLHEDSTKAGKQLKNETWDYFGIIYSFRGKQLKRGFEIGEWRQTESLCKR